MNNLASRYDINLPLENNSINWSINRTGNYDINFNETNTANVDLINNVIENNIRRNFNARYYNSLSNLEYNTFPRNNMATWIPDGSYYEPNNVRHFQTMNEIDNSPLRFDIINNLGDFIPFNEVPSNRHATINISCQYFEVSEEECDCCICLETREIDRICLINCQHKFCVTCINQHLQRKSSCPLCRTQITDIQVRNNEVRSEIQF